MAMFVGVLTSVPALAGQNAGAVAHLYWQEGTAAALDSPRVTTGTPQLLVTAKGIHSLRGGDVQLLLLPCAGGEFKGAWQGNGTGGCNDGNWSFYVGGPGGAYESLFGASPTLEGLTISSNQEYYKTTACGHNTNFDAVLWLHGEGPSGVARDSTVEYGIWAIKFDLRDTSLGGPASCPGDLSDPAGAQGVFFWPCNAYPCGGGPNGTVIAVLDGNGSVDYLPVVGQVGSLYWNSPHPCGPPLGSDLCPTTGIEAASWGQLRSLYR